MGEIYYRFCWFCVVIVGCCLVACNSTTYTNESDKDISYPIQIFPLDGPPLNYVHGLHWSVDAKTLFFGVDSTLWTYNVSTKKIEELESDNSQNRTGLEQSTPTSLIQNDLINITDDFAILTVSPSRYKALLYQEPSTFGRDPSEKFSDGDDPYFIDVWIWEEGDLKLSGTIEICGPNRYIWDENENFVGIQAPLAPARCDQSSGWLVDIGQNKILSVLPLEIYRANSLLHSFSPESDFLLISYSYSDERGPASSLQILDLETLKVSQLTTPFQTDPVEWINNDELLILYKDQLVTEVRKMAFLNVKSNQIADVINRKDSTLNKQYISEASVSPDKNWIAFTVESQRNKTSSLWMVQINSSE
jgi:hypothetical protein